MYPPRLEQNRHSQQQHKVTRSLREFLDRIRTREQSTELERERERAQVVIIVDAETLRIFIQNVYMYSIIFILVTSMTLLVMSAIKCSIYPEVPVPYFVWILLAFTLQMIMNCFPQARHIVGLNWVLTIWVQILVILAGACVMHLFPSLRVLASIVGSLAIVGIFYAYGAMCPQKLLPGYLFVYFVSFVFGVTVFVCVVLITFGYHIFNLVFAISLFCCSLLVMPFHAQYIHGRLEFVVLRDMLHSALTIYMYFVAIVFAIQYFNYYH